MTSPWWMSARFRRGAAVCFLVVLFIEAINAIAFRDNDFYCHYSFGEQFLAREPYSTGAAPYPLARYAFDSLLALMPYRVARGVLFLAAVGGLLLSYRIWTRVLPAVPGVATLNLNKAAAAFTLLLLYPYVIRDLDDCGLQMMVLMLLSLGLVFISLRKHLAAGLTLAVAALYKVTPIYFAAFLLWKRQWTAAASMFVLILAINGAVPRLYLTADEARAAHQKWWARCTDVFQVRDPLENGVEEPRHQNQGLSMSLARYLITVPPDHPLYLKHPWFLQFGNLDRHTAHRVVTVFLVALGGVLAWRWRRPWGDDVPNSVRASEWSVACGLCALVSPSCWLQHYILLLPATFLIIRAELISRLNGYSINWFRRGSLAIVAMIVLLLQRDIVGKELSILLLSYKIDTIAASLILGLATTHAVRGQEHVDSVGEPNVSMSHPTALAA